MHHPFLSAACLLFLLGALGLVLAYVASRTVTYPALNLPEPVDGLGVFSKVLEILFMIAVLAKLIEGCLLFPSSEIRPRTEYMGQDD